MLKPVCGKCGSTNIDSTIKLTNEKYRKIADMAMGCVNNVCVFASRKLICRCNDCGHEFEVQAGTYIRKLSSGEKFVD